MQNYYCECGNYHSYGSMAPNLCAICEKCGTTPTLNGIGQPKYPLPHRWNKEDVDTDEGRKTLTTCIWCGICFSKKAERRP